VLRVQKQRVVVWQPQVCNLRYLSIWIGLSWVRRTIGVDDGLGRCDSGRHHAYLLRGLVSELRLELLEEDNAGVWSPSLVFCPIRSGECCQ